MKYLFSPYITMAFGIAAFILGLLTWECIFLKVCLVFLVLYCISKGMKEEKLLNPYILFLLCPISLLIYRKVGIAYMLDLTPKTYILAISNMIGFIAALNVTRPFTNENNCIGVGDAYPDYRKHSFWLIMIGTLSILYTVFTGKYHPLSAILSMLPVMALSCAFCSQDKNLIMAVLCLFILPSFWFASKTGVLTVVLSLAIFYEKQAIRTIKQRRKIVALSVVAILVMVWSFSYANKERGEYDSTEGLEYYKRDGRVKWNYNASLFMPYMYACTPWANLQYVTETQDTRTYGLWFVKPFLGYAQLDDFFQEEYKLKPYSSFNTFTFIAVQFKDFGYVGSILISFLLGIFVKKIYTRYLISLSPLDIACYVMVIQAELEMFFSNHFFSQSYPFTIVIITEIYKRLFCFSYDIQLDIASEEENNDQKE